jgi:NTE family protein
VDRKGLKGSGGFFAGNKILIYLDALISDFPNPVDFDHLYRRFRAVATDIGSGEEVILKTGSMSEALRASMGIPGAFAPFVVDGRALVDRGLVNNLPVDVARAPGAGVIIAVDLQSGFHFNREVYDRTPVESLSRTIDTMVRVNVQKQLRNADLVVAVDLRDFTAGDFSCGAAIMAQGEVAARNQYAALTELRDRFRISGAENVDRPAPPAATAIDRIRIAGGTEAGRKALRRLLAPVVERQGGPEALAAALLAAYAERPLQSIRADRDHTESTVLGVNLQSRIAQGNTLRLGLRYAGTYADSVSSRLTVTPGLGVAGHGSIHRRGGLDALGLKAVFYQAFAAFWYTQASFSIRQDFDTFSFSSKEISSVDYLLYKTTSRA